MDACISKLRRVAANWRVRQQRLMRGQLLPKLDPPTSQCIQFNACFMKSDTAPFLLQLSCPCRQEGLVGDMLTEVWDGDRVSDSPVRGTLTEARDTDRGKKRYRKVWDADRGMGRFNKGHGGSGMIRSNKRHADRGLGR
eukprot:1149763-Pelagomonas_calceolata.AAC.3